MSRSVELADAITAFLNDAGNSFVLSFEAVRRAAPLTETELQNANQVQVLVFTGSTKTERITRGQTQRTYKPVIGIQRPLKEPTAEANLAIIDQLQELVEQIETALEAQDFELAEWNASFVSFDEEQYAEVYNAEILRDLSFFASAIELEYASG